MDTYEQGERLAIHEQLSACSHAPLAGRREARTEYTALMQNPEHFVTLLDYILAGHYGEGAYLVALDIANNKRMNRAAGLAQLLAGLECQCPGAFARKAYLDLDPVARAGIDGAVAGLLADFDADQVTS